MRIPSTSFAFTLLLGALAAVPYSGIDINLPALAATGAALGANASNVGLTMSVFVLSLAVMPLLYGPASDRFGRKPIVLFGILVFVVGSVACAVARSLLELLASRVVQGIGAAATGTIFAIIRDLFDGHAARIRIANVTVAVNVATMIAPTAGAALLALGDWRLIYAVQAGIGVILVLAVLTGFSESAKLDKAVRPSAAIVSSYRRVLTHPVSFGYVLVGAAAGATVFAYVSGASLFFIGVVGLRPDQYGLIFSACSAAVMCGAFLDGRLGLRGMASAAVLATGLKLMTAAIRPQENISLPFFRILCFPPAIPARTRGASRSSRTLGWGCGGRDSVARRAKLSRTAKPCGPGLPTLRSSCAKPGFARRRGQQSPVPEESAV